MRKIICFCLLFVLGACAATTQAQLDNAQNNLENTKFEIADKSPEKQNNLDLLLNGIALFHENKFNESDSIFEEFNKRNLNETSS